MQDFTPAFPGLYTDDIVELNNIPYTDWPALIPQYGRFRIKHNTADDYGYEQVIKLRDGLVMRSLDLKILRDNTVAVCSLPGYVSFYFHIKGHCLITTDEQELPHNPGLGGIYFDRDGIETEDYSQAGVTYSFVEVLVEKQLLLQEFFDNQLHEMPEALLNIYQHNKAFYNTILPLDAEANQAIQVLLASDYQHQLRDKFLEAKANELVCLMLRMLKRKAQEADHRPLSVKDLGLMERAREILVRDLASPPSVEDLSRQLGVGKSLLQERFKQVFGMSLRHYLLQARMEEAKALLHSPELSINQISWQLGYEHSCNLVTAFKRQYGLTPNAYRKIEQQKD